MVLQKDGINDAAASLKENFSRMQWAEQLVILSRMAGSLSYEIKSPLAGVKAATEVLSTDSALSHEHRDVLKKVLEQIRKIEVVLKGFLNFAKPPEPRFVQVGLNNVLDATVGFAVWHPAFSSRKGNSIRIVKDYGANLPDIFADPIQLQQVFMNLLINSAEAMQAAGTITIHSSLTGDKRSVLIRLADTGHGIDDETAGKIFQPFFTTKAGGTGLGLAVTKEVIEQHGGEIRVVNNHDRGVSFTILIPVQPGEGEMTHDGAGPNNARASMN
jgi:signal transduction histidine kinase